MRGTAVATQNVLSAVWMVFALTILFLLQFSRTLAVWGVAPNLVLVFLVLLAVRRVPPWFFLAALASLFVLAFFWAPFWFVEVGVMAAVALGGYGAARYLTGNRWVDVALLAGALTLLFALAGFAAGFAALSWRVLAEAVYNVLLGIVCCAALPRRMMGKL